MDEPKLRAWMQEYVTPARSYAERPGRWVGTESWPLAEPTAARYVLAEEGALESEPFEDADAADDASPATWLSIEGEQHCGEAAGVWCANGMGTRWPRTSDRTMTARSRSPPSRSTSRARGPRPARARPRTAGRPAARARGRSARGCRAVRRVAARELGHAQPHAPGIARASDRARARSGVRRQLRAQSLRASVRARATGSVWPSHPPTGRTHGPHPTRSRCRSPWVARAG